MPTFLDMPELLKDIPIGAWVAISADAQTVLAYSADLDEALSKARDKGENDPIVVKVPEFDASLLLLHHAHFHI